MVGRYPPDADEPIEVNYRETLQSEKDFIMQRRKHGLLLHACYRPDLCHID